MTAERPPIDLGAFSRPTPVEIPYRPRRWTYGLLPLGLLIGLALVLLRTLPELLEEARDVTLARPRRGGNRVEQEGTPIFQAAGWVEPDPFPIRVTSLADGVIAKILVQENERVENDQVIAELITADADLALAAAEAQVAVAAARVSKAQAQHDIARENFEAALSVREAAASANALLAGRRAAAEQRAAAVGESDAAVTVAERERDVQVHLRSERASGPWQVELAEARLADARARRLGLAAEAAVAAAAVDEAAAKAERATRELQLRFEDRLRVQVTVGELAEAVAGERLARVRREEATLRRSRMLVRSPSSGVVLTRDAEPGQMTGPGSGPLCTLYDPTSLRLRVDVPQALVGTAAIGQRAIIRSEARRDRPYEGRVLRRTDLADLQKVTLEVQVRVSDPDDALKPNVLCQVTVLSEGGATADQESSVLLIPATCLVSSDAVFVVDGVTGRASRRTVRTGPRQGDEVAVLAGLDISDKVISSGTSGIVEGSLLRIRSDR